MRLVTLKNNPELITKHNKHVDKVILEHPESKEGLEKLKLQTINDLFHPYSTWVNDIKVQSENPNANYFNVTENIKKYILDSDYSLDNVYVTGLNWDYKVGELTDYKIDNNNFNYHYGVSDNAQQVLDYAKTLDLGDSKEYIIVLTPFLREYQPKEGGWRWHKWGEYIGVQDSTQEYLYDEYDIDLIYSFTIREVLKK